MTPPSSSLQSHCRARVFFLLQMTLERMDLNAMEMNFDKMFGMLARMLTLWMTPTPTSTTFKLTNVGSTARPYGWPA